MNTWSTLEMMLCALILFGFMSECAWAENPDNLLYNGFYHTCAKASKDSALSYADVDDNEHKTFQRHDNCYIAIEKYC